MIVQDRMFESVASRARLSASLDPVPGKPPMSEEKEVCPELGRDVLIPMIVCERKILGQVVLRSAQF